MRPQSIRRFLDRLVVVVVIAAAVPVGARAKAPLDVRDYLRVQAAAESASAAARWKDATRLWEQAATTHPHDGRNWDQLANARFEAGDFRGAIEAYERSIALGWWTPPQSAYRIAAAWARLGDRESTLRALQRAFDLGYNRLEQLKGEETFAFVRDDARFKALVGLPARAEMSRADSWSADLALVEREVKRRGWALLLAETGPVFEQELQRFRDAIPKHSDARLALEMKRVMASVGDGHTNALVQDSRPEFALALPLKFYLFEEGLFVIAATPAHRDLLGAQVTHIGGRAIDTILPALHPYISHEPGNEIWYRETIPFMLRQPGILHQLGLVPAGDRLSLSIRDRGGRKRQVEVPADTTLPNIWNVKPHPEGWEGFPETLGSPLPHYLRQRNLPFWFEMLPSDGLVYAQMNSVRNGEDESLADWSRRLFAAVSEPAVQALVLDLRWNNGGNTGLVEPLVNGLIAHPKLQDRGSLFVVIGRRTFSAAQNLATYIEQATNAIFVGEPTGSSPNFVGEEMFFQLPHSGVLVNVSDRFWQSSWPIDRRTWIAPALYTPPTFAAYRENRDVALEGIRTFRSATAAR